MLDDAAFVRCRGSSTTHRDGSAVADSEWTPAQRYDARRGAGELIHMRRQKAGTRSSAATGHRVTGRAGRGRYAVWPRSPTPPARRRSKTGWAFVHVAIDDAIAAGLRRSAHATKTAGTAAGDFCAAPWTFYRAPIGDHRRARDDRQRLRLPLGRSRQLACQHARPSATSARAAPPTPNQRNRQNAFDSAPCSASIGLRSRSTDDQPSQRTACAMSRRLFTFIQSSCRTRRASERPRTLHQPA